jgi:cellulose synthase/poly-beta-1,6-N-acetylglucosamine synthase-like glycosyltransferase
VSDALAAIVGVVLLAAASRRLILVYSAVRLYRPASQVSDRPNIWIVCACRNEAQRLPALVASLSAIPYTGTYRIVLVDDASTDPTPSLMTSAHAQFPALVSVRLLQGEQRGKAGALREGLRGVPVGSGDLLLILDADHRLRADALDHLVNYFVSTDVSAVAIEHPVNRADRSLVSAYCFLEAAVGELVTSRGQHGLGLAPKLAGSWACRPDAFERLYPAGWQLIDDTVFSAAIVADGRRILHASDVVAYQDVPTTLGGYLAQHLRWGSGYAESATRSIRMRAGRRGMLALLDAVATHAGYFERPLLLLVVAIAAISWFAFGNARPAVIAGVVVAYYCVVVAVQIMAALRLARASTRLWFMAFASLPMIFADFAISIAGTVAAASRQRVGWSTSHR